MCIVKNRIRNAQAKGFNPMNHGTSITPPARDGLDEDVVVLGHILSDKDGSPTEIPVQLERKRHFHTLVAGDIGFGKTVAMERLVYETTKEWRMRSVVFDSDSSWRKMMNAPGLEGRVNVLMLGGGASPLRWNPLQVSRRIAPELHWHRFCEVFAGASGMGADRQMSELRTILYGLYIRAGVLTDDHLVLDEGIRHKGGMGGLFGAEGVEQEKDLPDYRNDHWWRVVDEVEAALVNRPVGTALVDMPLEPRQVLGRHRSRQVDLTDLLRGTRQRMNGIQDPHVKSGLQGIASRLETMVQGRGGTLYRKADDMPDICDIVPADGGITVLEGCVLMDGVTKAFLLGWAGWQIYTDAVLARVEHSIHRSAGEPSRERELQLVFDGADKILAPFGGDITEQWEAMWRDSRKYGVFLHAVVQTPSAMPPGIVSSSNNTMVTQLKSQNDVDALMSHLHRSAEGCRDEAWRGAFASIPVGEVVCKFGYTFDRPDLKPFRMRPLLLDVAEPRDHEIAALRNRWEQQGLIVKPGNGLNPEAHNALERGA